MDSVIRHGEFENSVRVSAFRDENGFSHRVETMAINKLLIKSCKFDGRDLNGPINVPMLDVEMGMRSSSVNAHAVSHSEMFSPALYFKEYSPELDVMTPKIDMKCPQNHTTWNVCRLILHNFGARVRFRLDIYNGLPIYSLSIFIWYLRTLKYPWLHLLMLIIRIHIIDDFSHIWGDPILGFFSRPRCSVHGFVLVLFVVGHYFFFVWSWFDIRWISCQFNNGETEVCYYCSCVCLNYVKIMLNFNRSGPPLRCIYWHWCTAIRSTATSSIVIYVQIIVWVHLWTCPKNSALRIFYWLLIRSESP